MKKTLFLLSAVSALCAAAPAAAQRYGQQYGQQYGQYGLDNSFDVRIGQLRTRLDAGIRAGTVNRREAWRLRQQLSDLDRLENRYSLGGFTRFERDDLQQRIRSFRAELRLADAGSYDRYERYGAWTDDDRYDGRYQGRGGPYEEVVCERRSGVGGVLDSLTGRENCYVVGDRVGNGLYAVPDDYRDRYRDRAGVYYRSDGRNVYAIDARTNTVIEVNRLPRD
jgi:hypothetical protein